MPLRQVVYWLVLLSCMIGSVFYGWPSETPTFTLPIYLPDQASANGLLAKDWLERPSKPIPLERFKKNTYQQTLVLTKSHVGVEENSRISDESYLIYLGTFYGGAVESAVEPIGPMLPGSVTWTRAIKMKGARIDPGGFLIVETEADWWYTSRLWIFGMMLGLVIDFAIALSYLEKPYRYHLQRPIRYTPPPEPKSTQIEPQPVAAVANLPVADKRKPRRKGQKS